jgi:hypothetical protein
MHAVCVKMTINLGPAHEFTIHTACGKVAQMLGSVRWVVLWMACLTVSEHVEYAEVFLRRDVIGVQLGLACVLYC